MKKLLALIICVGASAASLHAADVKKEEEFDRAAGLFKRTWQPPAAAPTDKRFPTPTPPQVLPGPPPWSQQPQGAQPASIVIIPD